MNGRYVATTGDRHEFPKLEAQFNEDPARFLQSSKDLALARIAGIRDLELLEAYRAVAKQILSGSSRTDVLEELDERKRELTGESVTPEPDASTPVPATDGGQKLSYSEDDIDETPDPDPIHPETRGLEAGQALVLERGDTTDYIFPSKPEADAPYLCRSFDGDDERTAEPIALSFDEVAKRLDGAADPVPIAEIDVDAPRQAAQHGGDE